MSNNQNSSNSKSQKEQKEQKAKSPSIFRSFISSLIKMGYLAVLAWFVLLIIYGLEACLLCQHFTLTQAEDITSLNKEFIENSPLPFAHRFEYLLLNIHYHLINGFNYLHHAIPQIPFANRFDVTKIENIFKILCVTTEITISRLFIFALAIPLFGLILMVFVTDGLVKRDIRKFQGARESTFIFHRSKYYMTSCFFACFFIYLSMPFNLNPILMLTIQGLLLGFAARLSTTFFKKYV